MANKQIADLTEENSLNTTFVIPVQKADGSEDAKKVDLAEVKTIFGITESVVKTAKTTVTNAQVLDIFDTPIDIVPSPGAGKMVVPISVLIIIDFNTTPYSDVGGAWRVTLGSGAVGFNITSFIGSATFDKETLQTIFYSATTTSGSFIDQPIQLTTSGNNPAGGDSGITVYVTYTEITTS